MVRPYTKTEIDTDRIPPTGSAGLRQNLPCPVSTAPLPTTTTYHHLPPHTNHLYLAPTFRQCLFLNRSVCRNLAADDSASHMYSNVIPADFEIFREIINGGRCSCRRNQFQCDDVWPPKRLAFLPRQRQLAAPSSVGLSSVGQR